MEGRGGAEAFRGSPPGPSAAVIVGAAEFGVEGTGLTSGGAGALSCESP